VGKYCDSAALAAVGTSSQPVEILLCLFTGIAGGSSILVARYAGARDMDKVSSIIKTATTLIYLVAIPLTIIGMFLSPALLRLMNVPEDAFDYALTYIRITLVGTVASLGFNTNSGCLKGLGDSAASLIFLFISSITNIVLDVLFVAEFNMGVGGVALATIIAQFLSWFASMIYIRNKYPEFNYTPIPQIPQKNLVKELARIAIPLGFNSSIYSVGHLVVQALVNLQGTDFMAGCNVGNKITGISHLAVQALSAAGATYAGQNFGAGDLQRVKKGHLLIPFMSGGFTLVVDMLFLAFSTPLIYLFNKEPAVVEYARFYLEMSLPFYCMYAVFNGIINYAHGVGEIKYPTIINIIALWGIRIPSAFAIAYLGDGKYVILSFAISFLFGMISMLLYYRTKSYRRIFEDTPAKELSA
ncbi:MAG: MATE family efflux transporter, partial [Lachnospiraceae bacterium]|nr:MATE family efflux transporter [Lachnospiraceae bacterium]